MKKIIGCWLMLAGGAFLYGGAMTALRYPISSAAAPLTLGVGCFVAGLVLILRNLRRITVK